MKKQEELVIISKTYDLILWSCNHTGRFPRQHRFVAQAGGQVESTDTAAEISERLAECNIRVAEIEAKWQSAAGVDAALNAIESSNWPPPLEFDLMQVPILSGLEPVEPIETYDELLEASWLFASFV